MGSIEPKLIVTKLQGLTLSTTSLLILLLFLRFNLYRCIYLSIRQNIFIFIYLCLQSQQKVKISLSDNIIGEFYIKSQSKLKSDTNQLQDNLKSNTCPAYPSPQSDSSLSCVGFCTTQRV